MKSYSGKKSWPEAANRYLTRRGRKLSCAENPAEGGVAQVGKRRGGAGREITAVIGAMA